MSESAAKAHRRAILRAFGPNAARVIDEHAAAIGAIVGGHNQLVTDHQQTRELLADQAARLDNLSVRVFADQAARLDALSKRVDDDWRRGSCLDRLRWLVFGA